MKMHNNYALEHNKGIFVHLPMMAEYLRLVPSLNTIAGNIDAKNIVDMNFTDTETTVTYLDQHNQEHTQVIARYPLVIDDSGSQQFHIKVENPTDKILRITLSDFDGKNPEIYEIDTTELYERLTKLERIITVGFEGEQEPSAYTTFADLTKRGTSEFARVQVANATSDSPFENNEPMYGYVYRQSPVGTGYIYVVETATQGSIPRVAFGSFSVSPEGEPILQWNTVGLPREVKEELQNHEERITKLEKNGSSKLTYSGKDASGGLYDVDSVYFDNNMRQLTVASHDPNNPVEAIQSSMKLDDLINAVDGAQLSELDLTTQDKVLSIQGFDNTEQRNPLPVINVPLDGKIDLTKLVDDVTIKVINGQLHVYGYPDYFHRDGIEGKTIDLNTVKTNGYFPIKNQRLTNAPAPTVGINNLYGYIHNLNVNDMIFQEITVDINGAMLTYNRSYYGNPAKWTTWKAVAYNPAE